MKYTLCFSNLAHLLSHALLAFFFIIPFSANSQQVNSGTVFTNISSVIDFQRELGEGMSGIGWIDYDNDDDLDVLFTNNKGFTNGLFRNEGDNQFTNVTLEAGLTSATGNSSVVIGDIDNDGYADIFMSGNGHFAGPLQSATKLYHNQGDGTFKDISATANVPGVETALSAAMADINNDGYLDLFIAGPGHLGRVFPPAEQHTDRLYLNNGDLTFTDITESAGVLGGLGSCAVAFSDYDNDGWSDLFVSVCNDVSFSPTPMHLYRNNHDNTFTDVSAQAGLDRGGFWMSVTLGDIDNDGDFDLFASNFGINSFLGFHPHALYRNNGDGTYTDIASEEMATSEFGWGASFADFDNDGFVDLVFAGALPPLNQIGPGLGNPGSFFFNNQQGGFVKNNAVLGIDFSDDFSSGVAQADFDNNGFPDIAIATTKYNQVDPVTGMPVVKGTGAPVLLQNDGNKNHWLTVQLEGEESNRMAIGARIDLYTYGRGIHHQIREIRAGSSLASSETPWPTFGLGKSKHAIIKVTWPSGLVEWFPYVKQGRKVKLDEGGGIYKKYRI